jgi:HTH-type transcriptional regulator/antitoxin MqsA
MSDQTINCPICGTSGTFAAELFDGDVKHNGNVLRIQGLERSRCSACNASPVMTDQIRRNQVVIADAKRRSDGLLIGIHIRKIRERLGLTQAAAANVFGGGDHAFSKYERGEVIQSFAMDRLLRLAIDIPGVMSALASYDGGEALREVHMVSNEATGTSGQGALFNRQIVPQLRMKAV